MEHPAVKEIREHKHLEKHNENPEFAPNYWKGANNMIDAARLEKGSTIAIVVDKYRHAMGMTLKRAAEEKGMKARMFYFPGDMPIHVDHERLTEVAKKITGFDPKVTYLCVGDVEKGDKKPGFTPKARSIIYNAGSHVANKRFVFACPTITHDHVAEIMSGGLVDVQNFTKSVYDHIVEAHEKGGGVHLLTGENGDFSCKMTNIDLDDMAPPEKLFGGHMIANLPGGEVESDSPVDVSGVVEFTAGSRLGRFGDIKEKVTATFEDGKLEKLVAHSEEDQKLVDKLEEFMKEHSNNVMEFAVGTNPYIPEHLADADITIEKVLGTIHIGVGNEEGHHDLVAKVKKLTIGDDTYIKDGNWVHEHTKKLLKAPTASSK